MSSLIQSSNRGRGPVACGRALRPRIGATVLLLAIVGICGAGCSDDGSAPSGESTSATLPDGERVYLLETVEELDYQAPAEDSRDRRRVRLTLTESPFGRSSSLIWTSCGRATGQGLEVARGTLSYASFDESFQARSCPEEDMEVSEALVNVLDSDPRFEAQGDALTIYGEGLTMVFRREPA